MPDHQYRDIPEEIWRSTWAELEEVVIGGGGSCDLVPRASPDHHRASHWLVSGASVVFLKAVARLAYIRMGLTWRGPQTKDIDGHLAQMGFPVVNDPTLRECAVPPDSANIMRRPAPIKTPSYENVCRLSRPDQAQFRAEIIRTYGEQCAISGCTVKEVLDACHIQPHEAGGPATASNGILLRRDLHRLFDLGLIALDPTTRSWRIHRDVSDHYGHLEDGRAAPFDENDPRLTRLCARWNASQI